MTGTTRHVTSDELNKVISDFVDNMQNDGADGEDVPLTDDQRKFARGVIEGLLGDPEWDEMWGRVIAQQVKNPALCAWTHSDELEADTWDGTCGIKWTFTEGGPVENEVKYCPNCGKSVDVKSEATP